MYSKKTFAELGVCDEIVEACKNLNYTHATKIQAETLPYSLN